MRERQITLILFIGLLAAYLYVFPHWLDWNQNTRIDLTAAIVERGTLSIDAYADNTGDYAAVNGHAYSDKAPGLSFLAVPVYALVRPLTSIKAARTVILTLGRSPAAAPTLNRPIDQITPEELIFAARVILTTWIVMAVPSALFGAWLFTYLRRFNLTARSRALAVLTYGLASVIAPYSATLYGHHLAAMLLFVAWAYTATARRAWHWFSIGSLLGWAVIIEYPAVLIAGLIGLYVISTHRSARAVAGIIAGGAWPLMLLGAYNAAIFGSPWTLTYQYVANPRLRALVETGVLSGGLPSLEALWGLIFSPFRGLLFMSPVWLLSGAGLIFTARQRATRRDWWFTVIVLGAFTLLVSGSAQWWGGWAAGPRYLIPMLPWLVWPLGAGFDRVLGSRPGRMLSGCLLLISIVLTWSIALGGQYYAPDDIAQPVIDYSWPQIAAGDVARNAGMLAGLPGAWSLLPLTVIIGATFWLAWRATQQGESHGPTLVA